MPALPASLLLATTLHINTTHVSARFDPQSAIGATIDAHGEGETAQIFTTANQKAMSSAGFHPLSYRLATELCGEAWHWNPNGTWSDPANQQGYWVSDDHSAQPIQTTYGYHLPRRGNTIDQAHDSDWSRIDDGDQSTFWKSNPYLGDRPQWLFVDLATARLVDTVSISWHQPFAIDYDVQSWTGDDPINNPAEGTWVTFPTGAVRNGKGGEATLQLGSRSVRYVRVLMLRSSHTASPDAIDPRDRAGFAVREVSVGRGAVDYVRHAPSHAKQSVVWVSSTDPWHRASDIDHSMEQPGFDLLFASGLTNKLPMLTAVALLYGTPEDSAAEVRFLRRRGYRVTQIEMGEEPDGQEMSPEDYGELYLKWADAIHAVDRSLQLGGPAFQSTQNAIAFWPDDEGETAWIGRFVNLLRQRGRISDFSFFSFEWYPFDDVCDDPRRQLLTGPAILARVLGHWRDEGVPQSIPWLATEYGWSSYAARAEVEIGGALFNVEFVADFLDSGGSAAYFYGLEPDVPIREVRKKCVQTGNLILFLSDEEHRIVAPVAAFHAAQMMTSQWLAAWGIHELHAVSGTPKGARAWAVRRPDRTWAVMLLNKDPVHARKVAIAGWRDVEVHQFSRQQYSWSAKHGKPVRSLPPRTFHSSGAIELPAYSITVVTQATGQD